MRGRNCVAEMEMPFSASKQYRISLSVIVTTTFICMQRHYPLLGSTEQAKCPASIVPGLLTAVNHVYNRHCAF